MMALRTRAKETVQVEFREVSKTAVFIAQTLANHKTSMSLLQQNGFRPLTCQEAIVKIDQNPELKKQLKNKWFYLDGIGFQLSGYYTLKLKPGRGWRAEKTVYVWEGNQPLVLGVLADYIALRDGRRFNLLADVDPSDFAPVVVGVKIDPKTDAKAVARE